MRFEPGPLRLLTPRNLVPPILYWVALGLAAAIAVMLRGGWHGMRNGWNRRRRIWAEY